MSLCPRFVLTDWEGASLTEAEKRLVCGDPASEAWRQIPDNQATYYLKNFLAARGYYHPTFLTENDRIRVSPGAPTSVSRFEVRGAPDSLATHELRRIVGERLTPKLLDEVKHRLVRRLSARGYPCAKITLDANPDTGVLTAEVDPGRLELLTGLIEESMDGLAPQVPSRYRAFVLGAPYNEDFLTLTTNRILTEGMVQSSYFTTTCRDTGLEVRQSFIPGPPRLIRIGVGLDTERLFLLRAAWKHGRLGANGSSFEAQAAVSLKEQELSAGALWYYSADHPRLYLKPFLSVKHANETPYENLTSKLQLAQGVTWDTQSLGARVLVGPALNYARTFRGDGPREATFLSLGLDAVLRSHYFEFYRASPREGFEVRLEGNFTQNDWLSNVSAHFLKLSFEHNWNLGHWDPPFCLFSVRGAVATTFTEESLATSSRLPTNFRHFLGGSSDLRGFNRRELPGTAGGLTSVFLGTELRIADLLPYHFEPFVFTDVGVMGARPLSFKPPVFFSPGLGMRWQTKVGVVRATLARGLMAGDSSEYPLSSRHWQFYFSFGEEF